LVFLSQPLFEFLKFLVFHMGLFPQERPSPCHKN
jgi:hypothetical protein